MSRLKKLILASTILLELVVILIVYLIFFRNGEYEDIVKNNNLIDKIGDYEIYGKENGDGIDNCYLFRDKKIIDHAETAFLYGGLDGLDDECEDGKCKHYIIEFVNQINDDVKINSYLINREKNNISDSYDSIGSGTSGSHFAYYNDTIYVTKNGKYGLLNINTGKIVMETKYEDMDTVYNDMVVATINDKVGLYNKNGEELLKPEYDYIGVVGLLDDYTYISIKGDEVKTFDKDLNVKKLVVKDGMELNGLYHDDVIDHGGFWLFSSILGEVHNLNVNKNNYFIYKGKEITGEQNVLILKFRCEKTNENDILNNESIIYVVKDDKLIKLDPSLIELANDYVCYGK